jgi:hypothetical protein
MTDDLGTQVIHVVIHNGCAETGDYTVDTGCKLTRTRKTLFRHQCSSEIQSNGELNQQLDIDKEIEEVSRSLNLVVRVRHGGDVPLAIGNEKVKR